MSENTKKEKKKKKKKNTKNEESKYRLLQCVISSLKVKMTRLMLLSNFKMVTRTYSFFEIWLFVLFFPQFCKSGMSRNGYL